MARRVLTCRIGRRRCALPIEAVIETMRPLPLEPIADGHETVLGVAVIRSKPTVVVDLGRLLGGESMPPARFVTIRTGPRTVALAVEEVLGVETLAEGALHALPPLLATSSSAVVSLGNVDRDLLVVLEASRLAPEEDVA
ncbi:MAG: chemotaxis protein CheW [Kofleriaceae bacterium]|nr:chemotaxis protein CheW [Kofleriaceae bacterium]